MSERNIDDIELLMQMMAKIRSMLANFIENYDEIIPEYPEFKEDFNTNWATINNSFFDLYNYLEKETNLDSLAKEGLTGDQLQLKAKLLFSAYDEALNKFQEFKNSTPDEKPKKLKWYRKLANLFFKHGNSVLGSMADAGVPFVGIIGEFKDAAETTLERAETKKKFGFI